MFDINIEVFGKMILSFWVIVTRHAQSTQNRFVESFLQDGSITLGVRSQTGPKYQKQSLYNIFAISQGQHEG